MDPALSTIWSLDWTVDFTAQPWRDGLDIEELYTEIALDLYRDSLDFLGLYEVTYPKSVYYQQ